MKFVKALLLCGAVVSVAAAAKAESEDGGTDLFHFGDEGSLVNFLAGSEFKAAQVRCDLFEKCADACESKMHPGKCIVNCGSKFDPNGQCGAI